MEKYHYYKIGKCSDYGKDVLFLNIPLGKNGGPTEDSVSIVKKNIDNDLGVVYKMNAFRDGTKVKEYWENTDKTIYRKKMN